MQLGDEIVCLPADRRPQLQCSDSQARCSLPVHRTKGNEGLPRVYIKAMIKYSENSMVGVDVRLESQCLN